MGIRCPTTPTIVFRTVPFRAGRRTPIAWPQWARCSACVLPRWHNAAYSRSPAGRAETSCRWPTRCPKAISWGSMWRPVRWVRRARWRTRWDWLISNSASATCANCRTAAGEFDYILAHGLYSWVPAGVRDALLALCRARLAPQGIAFISYNAYPGQYERRMLREMLLYRGDNVESAREFLRTLAHQEAAALADSPDDILFHDILAPVNQPVWFHEFAAHARRHGLRYLGEADPHEMFDLSGRIADEAAEQELDFRKLRRFRQTLLCRAEASPARAIAPEQMDGFLFSKNPHGRRIAGSDPAVEAVAQALDDVHPLPVAFEELVPYAGSREALREILLGMLAAGCADPHVHDFPCEESVTARPRASRLARYEAAAGPLVTNLCHMPVQLDHVARAPAPAARRHAHRGDAGAEAGSAGRCGAAPRDPARAAREPGVAGAHGAAGGVRTPRAQPWPFGGRRLRFRRTRNTATSASRFGSAVTLRWPARKYRRSTISPSNRASASKSCTVRKWMLGDSYHSYGNSGVRGAPPAEQHRQRARASARNSETPRCRAAPPAASRAAPGAGGASPAGSGSGSRNRRPGPE